MRQFSVPFLTAALCCLGAVHASSVDLGPAAIDDINSLFAVLDTKLAKQDLASLQGKAPSSFSTPAASALASVVLYKADPKKHEGQFYEAFAIRDYSERSKGNYTVISPQTVASELRDIEGRYKDRITDRRASLLLAFCLYQDQNKWFMKEGQRISLARFFRGAFLSSALKGTDIDVLGLTNDIDRRTDAEDL